MITKQGAALLKLRGFGSILPEPSYNVTGVSNYGFFSCKDKDGNTVVITPYMQYYEEDLRTQYYNSGSSARGGYLIGSDGTPATDEDYCVGSIISTFSSTTSKATLYDSENNEFITYREWTITNTGTSPITIREICRDVICSTASEIGVQALAASNNKHILLDRTVLDTPIEIAAGESAILRYQVNYQ